jgi:glycosyltransferase involved in cell wall biosynthesis
MKKHIAMISEHASPLAALGGVDCGGQNVYVAQVALALAERGHRVDVFTRRDAPTLARVVPYARRVRVIHVDAGPPTRIRKEELLAHMPEFADFVLRYAASDDGGRGYDVSHANFFMSGLVADELRTAIGVPFVITFHALGRVRRLHQGDADGFPDEREAIEERLIAHAASVIAECPQDALDLMMHYRAGANRLRIIPCGVDLRRFHPVPRAHARHALGLPEDARILVQIGRMVPRKGVDDVIRAVERLRRHHGVAVQLLVVGGDDDEHGPSAAELRRLRQVAADEQVTEAVSFVGRRGGDVLRYYYSAADAFVTTPWYEPFGITPLEAMASGTPVIGSAVGGIKYTVLDGETGFLVPPRDPDAIAAGTAHLLGDEALRTRMGRNGITRVRRHFQWKDVAARIEALYDEVSDGATDRRRQRETLDVPLPAPLVAASAAVPTELEA